MPNSSRIKVVRKIKNQKIKMEQINPCSIKKLKKLVPLCSLKETKKMTDINIADQFAQIGQLLKSQFEAADKAKKEMDAVVASVKTEAQNKLDSLDKSFFDKLQKNEIAINELKIALNAFSKRILPRVDKTEKELGISSGQEEVEKQETQIPSKEEHKGKIATIEARLSRQEQDISKIATKLLNVATVLAKKE